MTMRRTSSNFLGWLSGMPPPRNTRPHPAEGSSRSMSWSIFPGRQHLDQPNLSLSGATRADQMQIAVRCTPAANRTSPHRHVYHISRSPRRGRCCRSTEAGQRGELAQVTDLKKQLLKTVTRYHTIMACVAGQRQQRGAPPLALEWRHFGSG